MMKSGFYRYTIFPDYGGAPFAWLVEKGEDRGGCGYCVGSNTGWCGHIPISDKLLSDFQKWSNKFERNDRTNFRSMRWKSFHEQGLLLSRRLKAELGCDSKVFYVKCHEDPARVVGHYWHILEDGTPEERFCPNGYILECLEDIEQTHNVRILYALESGSRAWGFASRNSDYDVRFIYIHRPEWYLSIHEKRDVIEVPISDDLDISGWDLRKALALFAKSNPPLLEWLGSPIIYKDEYGLADKLRELLATSFSAKRCIYHYLHMARGNYKEYLKSEVVRLKKYLYVLRPLLACLWVEKHGTVPPTEFQRLVEDARLSVTINRAIDDLVAKKMAGEELETAAKIPELNEFIEQQLDHFYLIAGKQSAYVADYDSLDELFREMLQKVWEPS